MKKIIMLFLLLFSSGHNLFAQTGQQYELMEAPEIEKVIDGIAAYIDTNKNLTVQKFEAKGFIIYSDATEIKKIERIAEFPEGRGTLLIYLDKGIPLKIIEREESVQSSLVFEAIIYILDWEQASTNTIKTGERKFSEGTCGIFEYEPLIELATELVK